MPWDDLTDNVRRIAQTPPRTSSRASLIGTMIVLAVAAGVLSAAVVIPGTAFFAATANDVTRDVVDLPLELDDAPNPQTTRLYAADGSLLAYFYEENRQDVPLDSIAKTMQEAIVSIEDNRFYEHGALDLKGTLRALVNNASDGQTQGGSTITQQLVKLSLVQQATTREQIKAATEKSTARKVRELKLAIKYEEEHSKKDILERYLNIAYFGDSAYGINAAAYHYFSVPPEKLSVKQAATLAGLVKNPEQFNPRIYPERALQRRNTVIQVMATQGKISQAEADKLIASPLDLKLTRFPNGCVESVAAFSCDYIRQYLLEDEALGKTVDERRTLLEKGGLTIKSTIDVRMQKAINAAVTKRVGARDRAVGSMALVEPGTGNVRGVAQSRPMGRDEKRGQTFLNFSVPTEFGQSSGFQGGSTFKMFTTVAALKSGIPVGKTYNSPQSMTMPAGTYFDCQGRGVGAWPLKNSTGQGTFNMYTGLRRSVNTYFSQLERDAGLCNTVKAARDMGIKVPERDVVGPFTLGSTYVSTLEMAAAYATAASGGTYCTPRPVDEILSANGEVLKKYPDSCKRVMSREVAAQVNDILRGVQQPGGFGFQNGTALNIDSAAKTGTTNSAQSVWYVGYTPTLSAAAMISGVNSADNPASLVGVTLNGVPVNFSQAGGSSLSGPMWKDAMGVIQTYLPARTFDAPPQRQPAAAPPAAATGGTQRGGDQPRDAQPRGGNRGGGDQARGGGNGGDRPGR
ncbi:MULTISPECIES: transglycosylase domain-containing protein [Aeromicrobium]|jgi:membrane peptidoglycan carboxypeptidase|nr:MULTISPECIES: transglycosylase domain-containing protein [Aeromicrobium]